jgi:hypothetical protein
MRRQVLVLIVLGLAACDRGDRAPKPSASTESATKGGPTYKVDTAPPEACRAGEACTLRVQLTALRGYKVNKDYPFKFVPTPTDGLAHEGNGSFARDGEQAGTMTVTFRATAPGTAKVAGTFKLSVCSDDECQIEDVPVAVDVPVT